MTCIGCLLSQGFIGGGAALNLEASLRRTAAPRQVRFRPDDAFVLDRFPHPEMPRAARPKEREARQGKSSSAFVLR
jgi:hypothetical protein